MGTQLRQWAIRLLAAVALPVMLTLGLGVAANAQPVLASHVTSSTGHPVSQRDWKYGLSLACSYAIVPSECSAVVTRTARSSTGLTTWTSCGTCMCSVIRHV